jgi:hypothetical protein
MARVDDDYLRWPPGQRGWNKILDHLSATADRAKARAEIETVEKDYRALDDKEAARQYERWQALAKATARQGFELLCQRARQVERDQLAPNDENWPSRLSDELTQARDMARTRALYYKPCGKRHRFDLGLCLVWIYNGGGQLPDSDDGPFVRFFREIADRVLPGVHVTNRQVRIIAHRERKRVAFLFPASLAVSGPKFGAPALKINQG